MPGAPNPVSGDYFGTGDTPAAPAPAPQQTAAGWGGKPFGAAAPQPAPGWGPISSPTPNPTVGASWEVEDTATPVSYRPQLLSQVGANNALPEACAVANYISTAHAKVFANDTITLCFDIGGSTTDITAVCQLRTAGNALTMIKQNSIRFAAQMVAHATKYSQNFRKVLLAMCNKYNLQIEGLTAGQDSKFTHETAPFYF